MRYRLRTLMILMAMACAACAYARLYFVTVAYTEADEHVTVRFYDQMWQVRAFKPAAWIESLATGSQIFTAESEALWKANHPWPSTLVDLVRGYDERRDGPLRMVFALVALAAVCFLIFAIRCRPKTPAAESMRFRLRTLTVITLLVPPMLSAIWFGGGSIILALAVYLGLVALTKRYVFSDSRVAD